MHILKTASLILTLSNLTANSSNENDVTARSNLNFVTDPQEEVLLEFYRVFFQLSVLVILQKLSVEVKVFLFQKSQLLGNSYLLSWFTLMFVQILPVLMWNLGSESSAIDKNKVPLFIHFVIMIPLVSMLHCEKYQNFT